MIDKKLLKDSMGRPLTQGLFLEIGYKTKYSVYTLNDEDKEYEGKTYISLRRLYIDCADPTEYSFAKQHLLGWDHWTRLKENTILNAYFEKWREELEVMLRSEGITAIINEAGNGNFQAAKWLADKGWDKQNVGRPAKKREEEMRKRIDQRLNDKDFEADVIRLEKFK